MPECPVCKTEYHEGQDYCSVCNWYLAPISLELEQHISEREQRRLKWATEVWGRLPQMSTNHNHPSKVAPEQPTEAKGQIEELLKQEIAPLVQRMTQLEQSIAQRIGQLQRQLSEQETEHQNLDHQKPNQNSSRSESQSYPDNKQIKFVLDYRENPERCGRNAIAVGKVQDKTGKQPITLEISNPGDYWLFPQSRENYLVPQPDIQLNQYKYKTLEKLFICDGYDAAKDYPFNILKPAIVSRSEGETWELVERGILLFENKPESSQVSSTRSSPVTQSRSTINTSSDRQSSTASQAASESNRQPPIPVPSETPLTKLVVSKEERELVTAYDDDSDDSEFPTLKIGIAAKKINDRLVLDNKSRWTSYWIVSWNGCDYLVPEKRFNPTAHRVKETLKDLFQCNGYDERSRQFQLIKPAKVKVDEVTGTWHLLSRGALNFDLGQKK